MRLLDVPARVLPDDTLRLIYARDNGDTPTIIRATCGALTTDAWTADLLSRASAPTTKRERRGMEHRGPSRVGGGQALPWD